MKRYRVLGMDFDSRVVVLSQEIQEHWNENIKQQWKFNKEIIKEELLNQFGQLNYEEKLKNFIEIGIKPFSIIAFHNEFLTDCRDAFTIGAYYPALTGACALGERILNHLIILLRNDFKNTPEYKKIFSKASFDNWILAIDTLLSWGVLLPGVGDDYKEFLKIRNKSIHYNPETDTNDRIIALESIRLLQTIVQQQFGAFGNQPWFISDIPGEAYIKKDFECIPFIEKVYLPNCYLVGPKHSLEFNNGNWDVHDDNKYEDIIINDEQFTRLRCSNTCNT